jgi:hypothetical protein
MVPCHVSESFDESEPEATATESGASPMGLLSAERKVQREAAADGSAAEGRALFVKAQEARRGQLHSQQHISRKKKSERERMRKKYTLSRKSFQEVEECAYMSSSALRSRITLPSSNSSASALLQSAKCTKKTTTSNKKVHFPFLERKLFAANRLQFSGDRFVVADA